MVAALVAAMSRRTGMKIVGWNACARVLQRVANLAAIFADNRWHRHFNALYDAELALSEVVQEPPATSAVRQMLAASVAQVVA